MNIVKVLLLSFLLIFGLSSCGTNSIDKDNSGIVSTVSVLENKKIETNKKNTFCDRFIKSGKYYKVWSNTEPKINETHIFCGEYNKRGKPTGFHAKIFGEKPETIVSIKVKDGPNKYGIYTANIELKDLKNNHNKIKFSSMFPDNLSISDIEKAIINAWENKTNKYNPKNGAFIGPSGLGFNISGYTYNGTGKIATAYPIYTK